MENVPEMNRALLDMHFDFAAKDEGSPLFLADTEALECQNKGCCNPLTVPTKQCRSGHLFCFNCHQGHLNCMLCPEKKLFPAPSVDAILNAITEVCPHKIRGCNEKFPFYELDYHVEESCKYSHLTCPIPGCFNRSKTKNELAMHLTRKHKDHVDCFSFGAPTRFCFDKHGDTRILLQSEAQLVFVVHYVVEHKATVFKFFCVDFCDDVEYTYKITNRRGGTTLLADTPVPITTFLDGPHEIDSRELSHDWRTGKSTDVLDCRFVINMGISPANLKKNM